MTITVIGYVLRRLKQIGIRDVFGVPSDYAFPVCSSACKFGL